MNIQPTIQQFPGTSLIGVSQRTSLLENITVELWQKATSLKPSSEYLVNNSMYAVELYPKDYFESFDPRREFTRWAAFPLQKGYEYCNELASLHIPKGKYAVFHYIGSSEDAQSLYQFIFQKWLASSGFELDHRPHFALMGEKYQNNHPLSEEDIWIPIV